MKSIKIGVSSCLMGEKVRYNGQDKYDRYIDKVLGEYFDYVSICPESEVGMGVPRKPVRLVGDLENPDMVEVDSERSWTSPMKEYALSKVESLGDLSGYIFKRGSPSCGVFRVKVYRKSGLPESKGQGLFAKALRTRWPLLPIEEEGRLCDANLRENFIQRVFGYYRLQGMVSQVFSRGAWVDFHQRHKFLLLSHNRQLYDEMGRLVASVQNYSAEDFVQIYSELYMKTLNIHATRKRHTDVLMHILGFFKKSLGSAERASLLESIELYKQERYPLIVPITLLKHYIHLQKIEYLENQIYLNPYPAELNLRNQI